MGCIFGADRLAHHHVDFHEALVLSILLEKILVLLQKLDIFLVFMGLPVLLLGILLQVLQPGNRPFPGLRNRLGGRELEALRSGKEEVVEIRKSRWEHCSWFN